MTMRYFLLTVLLAAPAAWGETAPPPERSARADFWLLVSNWPALEAIRPSASGGFDATGFGLGGGLYLTVREFANSELLAGIDGFIAANDSNVRGIFADVLTRQLYLGGSLKWALGKERGFTLDTGIGYHLADMAEVGDYYPQIEYELWEAHRVGGYVGASWDLPGSSLGSPGRWMIGFKVHFTDFGSVRGPGPLGLDAGQLDGPLYMVQVGYGLR